MATNQGASRSKVSGTTNSDAIRSAGFGTIANRISSPPPTPAVPPARMGAAGVIPALRDDHRLDGFELEPACELDHSAIWTFLQTIFQEPSAVDFQHCICQPRYEPLDRLVIRKDRNIVAHMQLTHRSLQWGSISIPTIDVRHLATLPEFRSQGLAGSLLDALQTDVNLHGAMLATIRAQTPEYFLQRGWIPWMRHCHSTTGPRRLLAELAARAESTQENEHDVRHWRRNELDALRRLYRQGEPHRFGGMSRDEDDWKWLVTRKGFDYIYVARPHADIEDLDGEAILGYAVVVDGNVVELMEQPGSNACVSLLTRVCRDAIEEGRHSVTMHAATDDPIHAWFREAYGETEYASHSDGRYLMARILQPLEFLRQMRPVLLARAVAAKVELPFELGIHQRGNESDGPLKIHVNRRRVATTNMEAGESAKANITLGPDDFHRLLLGECSIDRLIAAKRASADSEEAIAAARCLFPEQAGWRMPWDDLPSRA